MASGRSNKLVGQTGEYLVAAELSRQGLIATTFTGNVPHYDIIASNEVGKHVSVQVKASRGSSWQFGNVSQFFEITFNGEKQIIGRKRKCPIQRLVVVFVAIVADKSDRSDKSDRFYILTWEELRDIFHKGHKKYLERYNGRRPKKWDSLHGAIKEETLQPFKDKWITIERNLA